MTPAYRLWDPSKAVFFAFAAFFAMIISDAGYALLLGLILLAMWKRMGRTANGRGLRDVILALVIFSVVYGILVGSYFGVAPPAGSWLASPHVLDAHNETLMMWIAIGIGGTPRVRQSGQRLVAPAFAIRAERPRMGRRHSRGLLRRVGDGVFGGSCAEFHAKRGTLGSGTRRSARPALHQRAPIQPKPEECVWPAPGWVQRGHRTVQGFRRCPELLAIVRLGPGLDQTRGGFQWPGCESFASRGAWVLLGLLVLLVGHSINFAMGIMGGVVHCLRLNLIEFFNWSLPEEGEQFLVFEKKALNLRIRRHRWKIFSYS